MTSANNWIISIINRLGEQFLQYGFSYAYEVSSDLHVIEVNDSTALQSEPFKDAVSQEVVCFLEKFPEEGILFIDSSNPFPVEPPVLYKKEPVVEETWMNHQNEWLHTFHVEAGLEWTNQPKLESIQSLLGSVVYSNQIEQRETISVPGVELNAGLYNYAMAA